MNQTNLFTLQLARHKHSNRWRVVGGIEFLPEAVLRRLKDRLRISRRGTATLPTRSWIGVNIRSNSRPVFLLEQIRYATATIYSLKP